MTAPIRSAAVPPPEGLLWIAVDFDNTLAECHFNLETGINEIGNPIPGAIAKCWELVNHGYKIIIHTSRPWWDYEAIETWLNAQHCPFSRIVCGKLMAKRYVDDRNIDHRAASWLPERNPSGADEYTVTVNGPDGYRVVHLPKEQVEFFKGESAHDPYRAAAWLAYCDLWVTCE